MPATSRSKPNKHTKSTSAGCSIPKNTKSLISEIPAGGSNPDKNNPDSQEIPAYKIFGIKFLNTERNQYT